MTKIKICGLHSLEDVAIVNEVMPDYVGFVFATSKRQVSRELASAMRKALQPEIPVVGVFVKEHIEKITVLCKEQVIDYVQLHGEEPLEYILELKKQIEKPIIYVKRLGTEREEGTEFDLNDYPVEYVLFDTYTKDAYGGSGKLINYDNIPKMKLPVFIAGGLNARNVSQVIEDLHPFCVDVSSGVETDGHKDADKIREFIDMVRKQD